ncbi:NADPH-dependent F420 reductase [Rhizobium sp. S95]|uniref:NADPH-dependent F420 reductase n=1 Tax=Ciceribacter sichuanensis TaxID=2949647 RepID=A0AAJ1FKG7_9HYPH|nr:MULTISPECIES: NADPH-dependent F420 reductase [unclassified Ciceribacter]MCM2397878.1 NADPH-dependent F420 reductase [Ciceribacter sp. S95]MCO5959316.1 NADPH-dependent F420 reductase [Ciceribacter sp. S101]
MTTYAIIGSGAIGSALAERFHAAGVYAVIANTRGPASLQSITEKFDTKVEAVELDQALQSDVLILAVPYDAVPDVARRKTAWDGRTIVDATNAIDFPAFKPRDLGGRLSSEIVAELFPGAQLVKAFNTLPAAVLAADPEKTSGKRVLFLSGNYPEASKKVADLIARLGFAPSDLGSFKASGSLQHFGQPLVALNLLKD